MKWNGAQHHIINVSPSCCMKICGQLINKQMVLPHTCLYHTFTSFSFFFAELQVSINENSEDSKTYFSSGSCLQKSNYSIKEVKAFGGDGAWAYFMGTTELSEPHRIRTCAYRIKWKFPSMSFKGLGENQH